MGTARGTGAAPAGSFPSSGGHRQGSGSSGQAGGIRDKARATLSLHLLLRHLRHLRHLRLLLLLLRHLRLPVTAATPGAVTAATTGAVTTATPRAVTAATTGTVAPSRAAPGAVAAATPRAVAAAGAVAAAAALALLPVALVLLLPGAHGAVLGDLRGQRGCQGLFLAALDFPGRRNPGVPFLSLSWIPHFPLKLTPGHSPAPGIVTPEALGTPRQCLAFQSGATTPEPPSTSPSLLPLSPRAPSSATPEQIPADFGAPRLLPELLAQGRDEEGVRGNE